MPRILVALLVAFGIAAIWRRQELRNDTDRASKAIVNAASAARSRLGGGDEDPDSPEAGDDAAGVDAGDAGDEVEDTATDTDTAVASEAPTSD